MMNCSDTRDRLDAYLAGTLGAGERGALEAHVAGCTECAADLAAARTLAPLVLALPRTKEPSPELWNGIARRLGPARFGRWVAAPVWAIAAAFLLVAGATAATTWIATSQRAAAGPGRLGSFVVTETRYTRSIADLSAVYARQRDSLPPQTRALVERNLATIEQAITESRSALLLEPANPMLESLVLTAYQRKLDFLEQAAGLNRAG